MEMILKIRIPLHPQVFLLHDFWGLLELCRNILFAHLTLAASLLIGGCWNAAEIALFNNRGGRHITCF